MPRFPPFACYGVRVVPAEPLVPFVPRLEPGLMTPEPVVPPFGLVPELFELLPERLRAALSERADVSRMEPVPVPVLDMPLVLAAPVLVAPVPVAPAPALPDVPPVMEPPVVDPLLPVVPVELPAIPPVAPAAPTSPLLVPAVLSRVLLVLHAPTASTAASASMLLPIVTLRMTALSSIAS